jgi:hypothetical protein
MNEEPAFLDTPLPSPITGPFQNKPANAASCSGVIATSGEVSACSGARRAIWRDSLYSGGMRAVVYERYRGSVAITVAS